MEQSIAYSREKVHLPCPDGKLSDLSFRSNGIPSGIRFAIEYYTTYIYSICDIGDNVPNKCVSTKILSPQFFVIFNVLLEHFPLLFLIS